MTTMEAPAVSRPRTASVLLRVARKQREADGVVSLLLTAEDDGRLPDWTAGSHIDLMLGNGEVRQYSLCGDRWDAGSYRIAVLREPTGRGGSQYVHDVLQEGDVVGFGGPRNHFAMVPSTQYRFVAGGIGITPLLPMLRQAEMLGAQWSLLYGGRTRSSMAFLDELAAYGDKVVVHPQDEMGLLPLVDVLGTPDAAGRVYCCGPAPLLDAVERLASRWPAPVLRTERFTAKEQGAPARSTPFTVVLQRSGREIVVTPEMSVLDAVREGGRDVLSSCREGTCGTCETRVLDGIPDHRDSILDAVGRASNDCMFPCVSRACSDRLVLDL